MALWQQRLEPRCRARRGARSRRAGCRGDERRAGPPGGRAPRLPARRPRRTLPRGARHPRARVGRGRRCGGRNQGGGAMKGFTLIEILVAVAILAVALAATTPAASLATDGTLETRQRLLATWAAQNRVAELRARRIFPAVAATRLTTEQGGLALVIDEAVNDTPNPTIRRVDLAVGDARDPSRVLTRLTAYVAQ